MRISNLVSQLSRAFSGPRRVSAVSASATEASLLRHLAAHWALLYLANAVLLLACFKLFEMPDASWSDTLRACASRYLPLAVVSLSLLPAFLWDTLRLSNRFAGPVRVESETPPSPSA